MASQRTGVVLVASSFLPRLGGVEEHVLHVAHELTRAGESVAVWAVDRGDRDVLDEIDGIAVRYLPCPLPTRSVSGIARFAIALPGTGLRWWRAWRADRPRVLHIQCFGPNGVWAAGLALLARVPLVVSTHGETFMDDHGTFEKSALLRRGLRFACRRAVAVTACSAYAARDLGRFGLEPTSVVVVPNGVELEVQTAPIGVELPERYVAAVGRMVAVKGFDLLLRAVAQADGVNVVLAGDGPQLDALSALAVELGIDERVRLLGRLRREQVATLLAGADCLVVPSRVEAFGIVVLEGWRAGIPVIATANGGPPEFVTDGVTGLLVDPEDSDGLVRALKRLRDDPETAASLATTGRETVGQYTWARVASTYAWLYDSSAGPTP